MAEEEAPTTETSNDSMSLLAKNLFGENFHGEVHQPAETNDEQEEVEQEAEETEVESEQSEETSQGESNQDEPEYQEYELSQIAQLLGVEEDRLDVNDEGRVVLVGKVDGEPKPLPVQQLLDNAQMDQAAEKRLEDAKARKQTLDQEFEKRNEELQGKFVQAGKLIEKAETLLDNDSSKINWDQLREDDPAEFAAKKAEFEERRKEIEQMKQETVDTYQKSMQGNQQSEEEIQQLQQQELSKLVEQVPMKTQDEFNEWSANTAKYLMGHGFEKDELSSILDHRFYVLAHKARQFDEGQKKTEAAKKKVAKVPKAMKPGAAQSKQQADSKKVKKAKERFAKTRSLDDAFRYMKANSGG